MRRALVLPIVLLALVAGGCTHANSAKLPTACKEGFGVVLKALKTAPGKVTLQGSPISACFTRNASGDEIQIVGTNLITAAQQLGDRARGGDRRAALQLGYLIGAARRGSTRNNDLGAEIVRRMEAETALGAARRAAYERGLRAGSATG